MARLLIIEDEPDVREMIEYNLAMAGHEVSLAANGADGLKLARELKPDLVLLDILLPDVSGTEVCRRLKGDPELRGTPVIIVSARNEEIDRVVGFELGVDDYVTKPFSMRELTLRVRAVLHRRTQRAARAPTVEFGRLRIDREAHRVWVGPDEVDLTMLEFKLLVTMYDHRDRVQTREDLLDHLWGTSAHISSRAVDAHIKHLRHKLGPARAYVETVRGVGYRFAGVPKS